MPIFVSRFSAERIAGAGVGRVRNQRQTERRENARETDRAERAEQDERSRGVGQNERAQDQLPVATQTADSIRDRVRNRNRVDRSSDDSEESTPQTQQEPSRRTLPTQATLPGVRTVEARGRRSATAAATGAGRLDQGSENAAVQSTLNRFESLRNARPTTAGNARSAETRQAFRDIPSEAGNFAGVQARQLNRQADASIRLLRSNQDQAAPSTDAPTPDTQTAPTQRPTSDQISRANTTPEIQENLREDSSDIERGLRVDAEVQSQQNLRATAENAAQTGQARRESRVDANDQQVRDLAIQERQLEQSLRNTQREIRDLNNENNRLESSSSNATASTAANLANRTTLVV